MLNLNYSAWLMTLRSALQQRPTSPRPRLRFLALSGAPMRQPVKTAHPLPSTRPPMARLPLCMVKLRAPRLESLLPMPQSMFGRRLQTVIAQLWHRMHLRLTSFIGLYEQQDENQVDHNLRGVFVTDSKGKYSFYCLRPTPYPVSAFGSSILKQ